MNREESLQLVKDGLKRIVFYPISDVTEDTPLVGRDSMTLDSYGLTTLVIELEDIIYERYGKVVSIVSDKMYSINNSPMRTVSTLAKFLQELVK